MCTITKKNPLKYKGLLDYYGYFEHNPSSIYYIILYRTFNLTSISIFSVVFIIACHLNTNTLTNLEEIALLLLIKCFSPVISFYTD